MDQQVASFLQLILFYSRVIRDIDDLNELYERRTKACNKLESAETKAMKLANKRVTKKKVDAPTAGSAEKNDSLLNSLIPAKKRPSHRLGKIPFFGKKVDTIDWCSEEIANTNKELVEKRGQLDRYRPLSSAFIYFNDQLAAYAFLCKTGIELTCTDTCLHKRSHLNSLCT